MMALQRDRRWRLGDLLAGIADAPPLAISGIALASSDVCAGGLFLAFRGSRRHGIEFVDEALRRGAIAVVTDLPDDDSRVRALADRLPVISVSGGRDMIGRIAARYYGEPTRAMRVVATTGTNGKSSISWLIAGALRELGRDAALMGTLGAGRPDALDAQSLTTPDAVALQSAAAALRDDGVQDLALEASSHALDQRRLAGSKIDIAVFSNLSRDHLDYHATVDDYFEAKAALFALPTLSQRIICVDDDAGQRLWQRYANAAICVSASNDVAAGAAHYVQADAIEEDASGLRIAVRSHAGSARISSPLIGRFNIENLLLAFAALLALGVTPQDAAAALGRVGPPPGRMQRVAPGRPGVFVDFAHTPDALAAALSALRPLCQGRLWCVFGCGGDRDRGKRPAMAAAVAAHADRLVLTSDNPRGEAPQAIIDDMLAGIDDAAGVRVEIDRRRAIADTVTAAADDDLVLIAGKGHERTQTIAGQQLPFDDVIEARLALRRRAEQPS